MNRQTDSKELLRIVYGIVRGGAPNPAGIFGPIGMNRGLREELLKESGIVAGKIVSSSLSNTDIDNFFGLCQLSQANGLMSETDIDAITKILERNS